MKKFKIATAEKIPTAKPGTVLIAGVTKDNGVLKIAENDLDLEQLAGHDLELLGAIPSLEATCILPLSDGRIVGLVGLDSEFDALDSLRQLGGVIARNFGHFGTVSVSIPVNSKEEVKALCQGFALGLYEYRTYKSDPKSKIQVENFTVITKHKLAVSDFERIRVIANAVNASRDLVNQPANDLYPASFEAAAKKAIEHLNLKIDVWDEKALLKGGFGGLSAVGAGSSRPPRLIKISYSPKGATKHVALVGKGITFDTGGLSLKPAESMVGMKYDMTGAATVLQAICASASLGISTRITAWMCLAENMPSGTATRPNDVIKARNGKTIEVLNTDAEGRLVLADGLSIASEEHPDLIVDVATLTGAATIALGNRIAGLMGDNEAIGHVREAAESVAEPVWHMPLPSELRPLLNSDIADIANVKIGNRSGGMLIGGLFLREFVGKQKADSLKSIPWAHLDIAGPSDNGSAAYGFTPKGATGTMVRTLIALAESLAK